MSREKVRGTEEASSEWLPSCAGQDQREQPLGLKVVFPSRGNQAGAWERVLLRGRSEEAWWEGWREGKHLEVNWGRSWGVVLQSQGPLGLSLRDPRLGIFCSMSFHLHGSLLLWYRKPTGYSEVFCSGSTAELQIFLLSADGSPDTGSGGPWLKPHLAGLYLVLLEDNCIFIIDNENLTDY